MTRYLALFALLFACGAPADAEPEAVPVEADAPAVEAEPAALDQIVLSPTAEMLDAATHWSERWSAATGRVIVIGEGGHAIRAEDDVLSDAGQRLCGGTRLSTGVVVARVQAATCPGMYETLGHELGHLLGADGHSDGGDVMAVSSDPQPITSKALDLVCVNMTCPVKTPEA